jgi:hypothetical protein
MRPGSKFACLWQIEQRIVGRPWPSAPRVTGGWCSRLSSPCRGLSLAGWQLVQRGWVSTLPSSVNMAADRASVSDIDAKLSGLASDCGAVSETA